MSDNDREQICRQLDDVVTALLDLANRINEIAAVIYQSEVKK